MGASAAPAMPQSRNRRRELTRWRGVIVVKGFLEFESELKTYQYAVKHLTSSNL